MLHQTLESMDLQGVEHTKEVVAELANQINQAQQRNRKGIKAQKVSINLKFAVSLIGMLLKSVQGGVPLQLNSSDGVCPSLVMFGVHIFVGMQ